MSSPASGFPAGLLLALQQLLLPERYWIGFSGGLDSTVLLHAVAGLRDRLGAPLAAVHVDHGLQAQSPAWAEHCRRVCDALGVPLHCEVVDARPAPGESPEAAARAARYAAIARLTAPRGMLLTAHHRDDQAETMLLQLFRGAGVEGLCAMPPMRRWAGGWHARPLLGLNRAQIRAWALDQALHWIEDPSNAVTLADRNYLRHRVMPQITRRWPGAVEGIVRSAAHCAEAADLTREQAALDIAAARLEGGSTRLRLETLRALSGPRAGNLLRHWLREQGAPVLPACRLGEALRQLRDARTGADPRIAWGGFELRRYRDAVCLIPPSPSPAAPAQSMPVDWVGEEMVLGPGLGRVRRYSAPAGIDPQRWAAGQVQLAWRMPGLRCRPAGRAGHRSFKKLAQEYAIPPWDRPRIPLLLIDGELAAIANCCVCEPFAATPGATGWWIAWCPD